jgi:hypothetical protein
MNSIYSHGWPASLIIHGVPYSLGHETWAALLLSPGYIPTGQKSWGLWVAIHCLSGVEVWWTMYKSIWELTSAVVFNCIHSYTMIFASFFCCCWIYLQKKWCKGWLHVQLHRHAVLSFWSTCLDQTWVVSEDELDRWKQGCSTLHKN